MAKVQKLKLAIDLNDLFGTEVTDQSLREQIGGRIIEKIVDRTQSGRSLSGGPFKGYSDAYKKSLAFSVYGKSGEVDLTLTGDMLADLNIIDQTSKKITIGFNDSTENAKAFNHNTGDTLPKREFFGITKDELEEIKTEFQQDVLDFADVVQSKEEATTLRVLNRLLGEAENG